MAEGRWQTAEGKYLGSAQWPTLLIAPDQTIQKGGPLCPPVLPNL